MNFADSIKKLRLSRHLTQKEAAQRLNITTSSVTQWESGITKPKIDKLEQIAEALGGTVVDLFPESEKIKEKIAHDEVMRNPGKYSNALNSFSTGGIPKDLKDFVNDFLLLDEKDQEMYYYEIKAKILRKKEF